MNRATKIKIFNTKNSYTLFSVTSYFLMSLFVRTRPSLLGGPSTSLKGSSGESLLECGLPAEPGDHIQED